MVWMWIVDVDVDVVVAAANVFDVDVRESGTRRTFLPYLDLGPWRRCGTDL